MSALEMGNGQKKRRRYGYSILVVPDGDQPTRSIRLSARAVFFVKIGVAILGLHVLVGAGMYWFVPRLWHRNRELADQNRLLRSEIRRVENIASELAQLEESQGQIRALLGLGRESANVSRTLERRKGVSEPLPPISPFPASSSPGATLAELGPRGLAFLTAKPSDAQFLVANLPTLLPVDGVLTADFDPEIAGHLGIDIATKQGSVVRAAGAGFVVFADWTPDLGNLVILYHGNTVFSYYGHNARILTRMGEVVRKGEPIAIVGSSGESSGPHLHFEIWVNGKPQDPKRYLVAFARQVSEEGDSAQ